MIFVTLGTQAKDFSRLLKMVEDLANVYNVGEIVAQIGHTQYAPHGMTIYKFIPIEQYEKFVEKADVIISHAGTGALFSAIKKNKKVIAVARLKKYGEMIDNHQTEIVKKLTDDGYILDGTFDLKEAWNLIAVFQPKKNEFLCRIPDQISWELTQWGIRPNNNI